MCQLDNCYCRKIRRFLKNTGIFEERFLSLSNLIKFVFGFGSASNRSGSAKLVPSFLARNWTQRYDTKKEVSTCPLLETSIEHQWENIVETISVDQHQHFFKEHVFPVRTGVYGLSVAQFLWGLRLNFAKSFATQNFLFLRKVANPTFAFFHEKKLKFGEIVQKFVLFRDLRKNTRRKTKSKSKA